MYIVKYDHTHLLFNFPKIPLYISFSILCHCLFLRPLPCPSAFFSFLLSPVSAVHMSGCKAIHRSIENLAVSTAQRRMSLLPSGNYQLWIATQLAVGPNKLLLCDLFFLSLILNFGFSIVWAPFVHLTFLPVFEFAYHFVSLYLLLKYSRALRILKVVNQSIYFPHTKLTSSIHLCIHSSNKYELVIGR